MRRSSAARAPAMELRASGLMRTGWRFRATAATCLIVRGEPSRITASLALGRSGETVGIRCKDTQGLHPPRGAGTTVDMQNPLARYSVLILGIAACILVMLPNHVCCAIASIVGRLINAAVGLFVLGCGLAVISGQSGTILDAAFDGDSLLPIAFETIAWSGAVLLMSAIVFRVSGPLLDLPARTKGGAFIHEVFNSDAGRALAAGLLGVAAMYLLSRTELKGQAIGAAVLGGVATAFLGRRLVGDSQPILLMATPVFAIGIAQLFTAYTLKAPLDQVVVQRGLPGWSMAMPVDIAAGTLIGIPMGLGWTKPAETDE